MLINFSVENYRSIRDKQTLCLEQDTSISDDTKPVIHISEDLPSLLRVVAIYGANGSGKSNILRAAYEMRHFILTSAKGSRIRVFPFLLDKDSKSKPSQFEIEFVVNGIRYHYGYSATRDRVINEFLDAYPKKTKQSWFTRSYKGGEHEYEWWFGPSFKGEKETIKTSTRGDALFFSTAVLLNNEMITELNSFFSDRFLIEANKDVSDRQTKRYMKKNEEGKQRVIEFLKKADMDIDDFVMESQNLKDEQIEAVLKNLPKTVSEEEKEEIKRRMLQEETTHVRSVHINPETQEKINFPLNYESIGTVRLYALAGTWLNALDIGQTLFIDELENSLHCRLVGYLIKLFNNPQTNPQNAQLVLTTHSPVALDANDLRRDQIWFTNKNKEKCQTILYPLLRAKSGKLVRKDEKRIKAYLEGEYSAVPEMAAEDMLH